MRFPKSRVGLTLTVIYLIYMAIITTNYNMCATSFTPSGPFPLFFGGLEKLEKCLSNIMAFSLIPAAFLFYEGFPLPDENFLGYIIVILINAFLVYLIGLLIERIYRKLKRS